MSNACGRTLFALCSIFSTTDISRIGTIMVTRSRTWKQNPHFTKLQGNHFMQSETKNTEKHQLLHPGNKQVLLSNPALETHTDKSCTDPTGKAYVILWQVDSSPHMLFVVGRPQSALIVSIQFLGHWKVEGRAICSAASPGIKVSLQGRYFAPGLPASETYKVGQNGSTQATKKKIWGASIRHFVMLYSVFAKDRFTCGKVYYWTYEVLIFVGSCLSSSKVSSAISLEMEVRKKPSKATRVSFISFPLLCPPHHRLKLLKSMKGRGTTKRSQLHTASLQGLPAAQSTDMFRHCSGTSRNSTEKTENSTLYTDAVTEEISLWSLNFLYLIVNTDSVAMDSPFGANAAPMNGH